MEEDNLIEQLEPFIKCTFNPESLMTMDEYPLKFDFDKLAFKSSGGKINPLPLTTSWFGTYKGINFIAFDVPVVGWYFKQSEYDYNVVRESLLMKYN
jgi:hypothetical protein